MSRDIQKEEAYNEGYILSPKGLKENYYNNSVFVIRKNT
jgi:uncharacterized membrane protein